jgi:hypothetical protein
VRKDELFQGYITVFRKSLTLKMEAEFSFETSVSAYKIRRCHNREDNDLNNYGRENLRTCNNELAWFIQL